MASKSSLINMVALLLAFLVLWSMLLFCGLMAVGILAILNRINELSRLALSNAEVDSGERIDSDEEDEESTAMNQTTDRR